ncbi:MAG: hypothetical protein QM589_14635 [Thermomicrobiales bacterium]
MNTYPNDARWNQLQAMIASEMPEGGWTLRGLDEMKAATANRRFVQAVVGRDGASNWGEQVLGVGETEEAAVRDAIRTARRYPTHAA